MLLLAACGRPLPLPAAPSGALAPGADLAPAAAAPSPVAEPGEPIAANPALPEAPQPAPAPPAPTWPALSPNDLVYRGEMPGPFQLEIPANSDDRQCLVRSGLAFIGGPRDGQFAIEGSAPMRVGQRTFVTIMGELPCASEFQWDVQICGAEFGARGGPVMRSPACRPDDPPPPTCAGPWSPWSAPQVAAGQPHDECLKKTWTRTRVNCDGSPETESVVACEAPR